MISDFDFKQILISYREGKIDENSVLDFIQKEIEYFKLKSKKLIWSEIDDNHG